MRAVSARTTPERRSLQGILLAYAVTLRKVYSPRIKLPSQAKAAMRSIKSTKNVKKCHTRHRCWLIGLRFTPEVHCPIQFLPAVLMQYWIQDKNQCQRLRYRTWLYTTYTLYACLRTLAHLADTLAVNSQAEHAIPPSDTVSITIDQRRP